MLPLISVIIPVYNLETRIRATLECVLNQDHKNIELIVVDDASCDNTVEIVRKTLSGAKITSHIISHRVNSGVSAARNSGMKAANGTFLLFWDGDDLADSDFISTLFSAISGTKDQNDIAFCGYRTREEPNGTEKKYSIPVSIASGKTPQQIAALYIVNKITLHIWGALYRTEYLKAIDLNFFDGCTGGEDIEFVIKSLVLCRQLAFSPNCPYIYMQHNDMGSRKNADTSQKKLLRYKHNTEAHARTAGYLLRYATDTELRKTTNVLLIPQIILRELSIYAAENNKQRFNKIRTNTDIRNILWKSRRSFLQKPDVFLKSLMLLLLPNIFWRHYQKYF